MRSDTISNDLELQRKIWKQCLESMHSDGIGNYLELQRKQMNNENKDGKVSIETVFQTIWKCRKKWKQGRLMVHSDGMGNDILELERKFDNKDDKWCIMPLFDTIVWPTEKN